MTKRKAQTNKIYEEIIRRTKTNNPPHPVQRHFTNAGYGNTAVYAFRCNACEEHTPDSDTILGYNHYLLKHIDICEHVSSRGMNDVMQTDIRLWSIVKFQFGLVSEQEFFQAEAITPDNISAISTIMPFQSISQVGSQNLKQSTFNIVKGEDVPMSESRIAYARRELMLWCVTQAIPFLALENEHFSNYVHCLHPLAPIHSRRQIGVTELNKESVIVQAAENKIMEDEIDLY
jgi:hypothetical protein